MFDDGHAEAFHVTWERADRAIGQKARKVVGIKLRDDFDKIGRLQFEVVPDFFVRDHGAEEEKACVRHAASHLPNYSSPVFRALPHAPHAEENNFLVVPALFRSRRCAGQSSSALGSQSVRLNDRGLGRFDFVADAGELVRVRKIQKVAMMD